MKKIWKMKKDAVSPVIATILMVAITVVLAAVLYVMVMGFGGPTAQTPTGSFSMTEKFSATQQKIQFGVITPDTKVADVKLVITKNGGAWGTMNPLGTGNVTLVQLGGSANKVASGDYILITPAAIGGSGAYQVSMVYLPTGNIIGTAISFNW